MLQCSKIFWPVMLKKKIRILYLLSILYQVCIKSHYFYITDNFTVIIRVYYGFTTCMSYHLMTVLLEHIDCFAASGQ